VVLNIRHDIICYIGDLLIFRQRDLFYWTIWYTV